MFKRSALSVFLPLCLLGLASAGSAAAPAPSAGDAPIAARVAGKTQMWSFRGVVRFVDDSTGEEEYMTFGGLTDEMSREQAMEYAREVGAAKGARRGRVISVNISSLW